MSISTPIQLALFVGKLLFIIFISAGLLDYILARWNSVRKNWIYLRGLHQIPCSQCVFFTGDYKLKCAVHPCTALTKDAIGCPDYQKAKNSSAHGSKA
jgi:hypothetical protein